MREYGVQVFKNSHGDTKYVPVIMDDGRWKAFEKSLQVKTVRDDPNYVWKEVQSFDIEVEAERFLEAYKKKIEENEAYEFHPEGDVKILFEEPLEIIEVEYDDDDDDIYNISNYQYYLGAP